MLVQQLCAATLLAHIRTEPTHLQAVFQAWEQHAIAADDAKRARVANMFDREQRFFHEIGRANDLIAGDPIVGRMPASNWRDLLQAEEILNNLHEFLQREFEDPEMSHEDRLRINMMIQDTCDSLMDSDITFMREDQLNWETADFYSWFNSSSDPWEDSFDWDDDPDGIDFFEMNCIIPDPAITASYIDNFD